MHLATAQSKQILIVEDEGIIAAEDLERADSDSERREAQQSVETARSYCHSLRTKFLTHCEQHGC